MKLDFHSDISPITPLICAGGGKKWKIRNAARHLKSKANSVSADDGSTASPNSVQFRPRIPKSRPDVSAPPPLKLDGENVLNRQQLSRGLFDLLKFATTFDHVTIPL